jgi:NAD/NADP transhydrogenase beta subunit
LSKSVIDLAAAHLKRQFLYQTQRGRFGNLDALRELAISARGCIATSMSSSRVTVAFVLETVLGQCAEYLKARPVPMSEVAQLADRLHRPVSRAVEYLAGADDDPIDVMAALVKSRPARPG